MASRDRVQNRAELIHNFLAANINTGYTKPELLAELNLQAGSTTEAAIRRARGMAAEAGLHFPPAVPANGNRYMVTGLAENALDPTVHMGRIETGVRRRKESGVEFMRRERANLPPDLRPVVDMYITVEDATTSALSTIRKAGDEMVVAIAKARSDQRKQAGKP